MSLNSEHILVCCSECGVYPCGVECASGAISFFYGNIMIDFAKCVSCDSFDGGKDAVKIPGCVVKCKESGEKKIIDSVGTAQKRENTVEVLGLI